MGFFIRWKSGFIFLQNRFLGGGLELSNREPQKKSGAHLPYRSTRRTLLGMYVKKLHIASDNKMTKKTFCRF